MDRDAASDIRGGDFAEAVADLERAFHVAGFYGSIVVGDVAGAGGVREIDAAKGVDDFCRAGVANGEPSVYVFHLPPARPAPNPGGCQSVWWPPPRFHRHGDVVVNG